jgi:hypothetical protein
VHLRVIVAFSLLLTPGAPARPTVGPATNVTPSLLFYTVTKSYEPLAWLHGADRFAADAAIYIREGSRHRSLVPDFAASADPEVSFDGQRVLFAGKAHSQDPWQIWEITLPDGKPRRITSDSDDCIRPFYLPDDRIVYARKISGRFVIETSDVVGGKILPLTFISSNALPSDVLHDGRILFESSYPLGTEGIPELYTVYSDGSGIESYRCDHGGARHSGRQNQSGDIVFVSAHGLARFTPARAQEVPIAAPAGEYTGDVLETSSGDWILSWRPNATSTFRLVRWIPGAKDLDPLFFGPDTNVVQPTLIREHGVPNRHPSGLHDWPNANLLCLNAYTSKYRFTPGSIHTVRMYTRDAEGTVRLLGTAPVERDGSFFVQVPTEQPIQIELLDATGKTLKRESGFFWMRRGEQRGCVGCHAGPETAPENAVPMILLRSTTPADMTSAAPQSAGGH